MVAIGIPCFFEVGYMDGDLIWFVSSIGGGLFSYDLRQRKLRFLTFLEDNTTGLWRLVGAIVKVENVLVMAPFSGNYFYFYHISTGTLEKIKCVPKYERMTPDSYGRFWYGVLYDNSAYFVGCYYPGVVKIDPGTKNIQYWDEMASAVTSRLPYSTRGYFRNTAVKIHSSLLVPSCQEGFAVCIDLRSGTYKVLNTDENTDGFWGIFQYKNTILGLTTSDKLYRIEIEGNGLHAEYQPVNLHKGRIRTHSFIKGNLLYSFDPTRRNAEVIHLVDGNVDLLNCEGIDGPIGKEQFKQQGFTWLECYKDGFIVFYPRNMELCILNAKLEIVGRHQLHVSKSDYAKYYDVGEPYYAIENDGFHTLDCFLREIVQMDTAGTLRNEIYKGYSKWRLEDFLTV